MKRALKKMMFVEPKSTHLHVYSRVCIPRLGSVLLGTIMREKGYDVRVYIEDIHDVDMNEIFSADLVAVSAITSTSPQSYKLADRARAAGAVVVIGGTHTSFLPEEGMQHADFVVRGEGDGVSRVDQPSNTVERGKVISTNPPAGTQVDKGSTVTIVVSSGAPTTTTTTTTASISVIPARRRGPRVITIAPPCRTRAAP